MLSRIGSLTSHTTLRPISLKSLLPPARRRFSATPTQAPHPFSGNESGSPFPSIAFLGSVFGLLYWRASKAELNQAFEKLDRKLDRLEAKIDNQRNHFDAKFDVQRQHFDAKIDYPKQHFDAKFDRSTLTRSHNGLISIE